MNSKNRSAKHRYALCGLSVRGIHQFVLPLIGRSHPGGPEFTEVAELVGVLDPDQGRVSKFSEKVGVSLPWYHPKDFDRMIDEVRPDTLLVAGPDATHCDYIVAGLNAGCDVITEKPMVISCRQVLKVMDAEKTSGKSVRVAHNFRYTSLHRKIKQIILDGTLGKITNVEFVYNLDTHHGSSYFYRWNRERKKSGGLSIHKCCHHFDLINWWLDDIPDTVFALGALNYYGANGALRPRDAKGRHFSAVEEKRRCKIFQQHYQMTQEPSKTEITMGYDEFAVPYEVQYSPGKHRYIYDREIDVEDTYSVVVGYRGGASMVYSCNFCGPWEGYILGINGTAGRLEVTRRSDQIMKGLDDVVVDEIHVLPLFGKPHVHQIPQLAGGHGGADFVIQSDLFRATSEEARSLGLVADSREGAYAIAVGEAVWKSAAGGKPVRISKLLGK